MMPSATSTPAPRGRSRRSRTVNGLRGRVMRVAAPLIVLAFLGLAFAYAVLSLNAAQMELVDTHERPLTELVANADSRLRGIADDAAQAANSQNIREFARNTLTNVTGTALQSSQERLLADMVLLLEQHPADYSAVRYVTYTGSIWSEATRLPGQTPSADNRVRIGEQETDAYQRRALTSPLGIVTTAPISFVDAAGLMRLIPFVRVITPVASAGNTDNIAGTLQLDVLLSTLLDPLLPAIERTAGEQPGRRVIVIDSDERVIFDSANTSRDLMRDIATNVPLTLEAAAPAAAALLVDLQRADLGTSGATSGIQALVNQRSNQLLSSASVALTGARTPFIQFIIVDDIGLITTQAVLEALAVGAILLAVAIAIVIALYVVLGRVLTPVQRASALAGQVLEALNPPPAVTPLPQFAITPLTPEADVLTDSARVRRGRSTAEPESLTTTIRRKAATASGRARRTDEQPVLLPELDRLSATLSTDDAEVSELLTAFQQLSQRVTELNTQIETQVGRYSRNLDIAARIGRETATLYDTDLLLNRAIDLICNEYGFYHAQVFLIDEIGKNAVLVYSRGEAGKEMLARKHKLGVGSDSVIGRVTATGRPVLINDTRASEGGIPHRFNPLLPQTRAEMALPLQIGDRIIGALDIQSTSPNAFLEDDLNIFQLLADQIAIALENARLIVESDQRFQQIDDLNRQLTRIAWEDTPARARFTDVYRYDLMKVERQAIPPEQIDDLPPETETDNALRLPITIRGEVIGVLDAATDGQTQFSETDRAIMRAVADRVAIAIEAARLFEETQTNLAETSTLYQLSRYLNEANSLIDILQAIIVSVMPDATSGQIAVFDDYPTDSQPLWAEIAADWSLDSALPDKAISLRGLTLNVSEHPVLRSMRPDQVTIINDAERDTRLDEVMRAILQDVQAKALVLIPFSVRGVWRGVIFIEFPTIRDFSDREGRIYTALIDQAGVAIDNRLLLTENKLALDKIERLYTASRDINMAKTLPELVGAATSTRPDDATSYLLGLFEGELSASGWPSHVRIVAYSRTGDVLTDDTRYELPIPADSPLTRREPLIVVDRANAGGDAPTPLHRFMRDRELGFLAAFPLYSDNLPIALFFVGSSEPRDLMPEDAEVYRALTGQMSTVLQNRRLLEQTTAALDETRRLYTASRAIAEAADADAIYVAAAQHAAAPNLPISRASVLRAAPYPSPDAPLIEVAQVNAISGAAPFVIGQQWSRRAAPLAELLAGGVAVRVDDLTTVPERWQVFADFLKAAGTRSAIITPIRTRTRWFGALVIESEQPDAFTESFVRYTQAVADQVALALESAELFREARTEAQRALALAEAGQLANRISGDFESALAEVFSRVAAAGDYDRWTLDLLTDEGDALRTIIQAQPGSTEPLFPPDERTPLAASLPLTEVFHANNVRIINTPAAVYGDDQADALGKHVIAAISAGDKRLGALRVGRSLGAADFDERDVQLVSTLAAQVAVTLENQRLFRAAESERERLRTVLETLPAGVLVLDAKTLRPVQANDQAEQLLGTAIDFAQPFDIAAYGLYRTGRTELYPADELPIFAALEFGQSASADDVAVGQNSDLMTDLLVNAAPITDADGEITAIVAAFQDITALRGLEKTLQINLHDSIALYEATRALAEAEEADEVIDQVLSKLTGQQPTDAFVLLLDEEQGGAVVARSLSGYQGAYHLPDELLDVVEKQFVDNIEYSTLLDESPDARARLRERAIAAYVSIPLRARAARRDVPIGWLIMTFDQPQVFTPEREQFLSTLSDSAAVALDNRSLFRSTQLALEETGALYRATTSINKARSLEELSESLQKALETLSPDLYGGFIRVRGELRPLFNVNMDGEPLPFDAMLKRHGLLNRPYSSFIDDLRGIYQPLGFDAELLGSGLIRAVGVVQLRSEGQPSGALIVGFNQPRRFSSSDARYLGALADSASVVADNILLVDRIQTTLQETSMLYNATRDLADAETPEQVLRAVVDQLPGGRAEIGFLAALTTRTWESTDAAVIINAAYRAEGSGGVDLSGVTLTPEQYPAWSLLATAEVLTINDVNTDPTLDELVRAGVQSLELASLVVLPLRSSIGIIGALCFGSSIAYEHTDRDRRTYETFAEQVSLRLEASRLLAQTERRARQLATSAQVGQIASSILDLEELMPQIVDTIRDAFRYDHVQIFLMDDADDYAVLRASTGEAGKSLLGIKHKLQKGSASVIGQVTATGRPTIAADTADARVIHRPNPYLPNTRAEMAIPLILKGKVVGALDVQSNNPNAFDDDDVATLTTLASQIAVAIDNASLFRDSQQRANEMSFLFTVTDAAASATTLTSALDNVAAALQSSLAALSVSIYLPVQYIDKDEQLIPFLKPVALAGVDHPLSELSEINLTDTAGSLLASAASTRRPVILRDVEHEARYVPVAAATRAAIIVPLMSGSTLIGVIVAESADANAYDNATLTLLLTLAGTLSAIVQNQTLLEQVQTQNAQLQELDRLKSDFLANMSHELRTPLNSIIGFSRVILKGIDGPLTEMQEQDLSTIYNSGQHLLNLINDILDQAKIAAGKMDLQSDYFEMKHVIDGVRSIGIGLVKDKPIDIYVEIAPGLPKPYGDEFRTRQILLNLISNASKFTREGAITIRSYPVVAEDGRVMLRTDVTDTGIGIAEKDIPLLFEAFRQVDSSLTRTAGGTGLGLPIARSLVEMMGGAMEVVSTVNVGSTFSIILPTEPLSEDSDKPQTDTLKPAAPAAGATGMLSGTASAVAVAARSGNGSSESSNGTEDTGVFEKPTLPGRPAGLPGKPTDGPMMRPPMPIKRQILLIEDNVDMVDQFRRSLQREGFDIFAASIPLEAEAMASGLHPTLIVMDVSFAEGAGWDILTRLKQRDDTMDIPVIVVSLNADADRLAALDVFRYIPRPFSPDELVKAVADAERASRVERILIIDDQPDARRLMAQIIDEQGQFRVFTAGSGMEGIALVARRRPNLIVLDLRMPDMDGFDVVRELRGNPETANLPILIVTGDSITEEERTRLANLRVIHKTEISADRARPFVDGVRSHIQGQAGD